ncbi:MAG: hypothetical protein ABFD86_11985 [Bryobacteraceae bacterium]
MRTITTRCQTALQAIPPHFSALFVASVSMSGLLLTPVAVLAGVLGTWRLGADLGFTSNFFIADGVLSRYQFWFALAIGAQTSAIILNRRAANRKNDLPARTPYEVEP